MRGLMALVALLLAASHAGCAGCVEVTDSFPCTTASECLRDDQLGACVEGSCAFPDDSCDSGLRYGELSGDSSGACTAPPTDDVPGQSLRMVSVVAGLRHTCALEESGRVFCWGDNSEGQAGGVSLSTGQPPTELDFAEPVTALAAGGRHTCAIAGDDLYCWGDNQAGQLGSPVSGMGPTSTSVLALEGVREVDAGAAHTCAIRTDNSLHCWGSGGGGQIGDGEQLMRPEPVEIDDGQTPEQVFERLALGARHSCASVRHTSSSEWSLVCWGSNDVNQHGTDTGSPVLTPTEAIAPAAGAIIPAAAGDTTCIVRTNDSTLRCFGDNGSGQAGVDAATDPVDTPTAVSLGGSGATQVALGRQHGCASQQGPGFLFCFGTGDRGELGVDPLVAGPSLPVNTQIPIADSLVPAPAVGTNPLKVLAMGDDHGCAIVTQIGDEVWCWGSNEHGQTGFESPMDVLTPTQLEMPRQ